MHPDNVQALKEAKVDYCSLANNHTLDFMEEGMVETTRTLSQAGIVWAGVGMSSEEAAKPAILERNGKIFACFRYEYLERVYCIVMYCIVLYCIVLYCIVLYCIVEIILKGRVILLHVRDIFPNLLVRPKETQMPC